MTCDVCGVIWCDSCRIFPPQQTAVEEDDWRNTHRWRVYGRKMVHGCKQRVYLKCMRCNVRVIEEHASEKIRWFDTHTGSPIIRNCKHS